ncbi:hypothetical protein M407DRAFT_226134 [Tulasnella calospora MUT 4182]|uniref:Uncharacterized protein n=1 Tax=Tulasnella calospora MUT 4182 TaxID=1051891 RepID=A0A0C3M8E6_9AGAM|nr:hypothetical protein M407DRAFT_226134 [Tulasnella calospora MUT 4182]
MNNILPAHQTISPTPRMIGETVKALMANALYLQTREVSGAGRSAKQVQSILEGLLPVGSPEFALIPVAPIGSHETLDRYLLVWCKCSSPDEVCHPQAADSTSAAAKTIYEASSRGFLEYATDEMKRRGRDRIILWVDDWVSKHQGKPLEHIPYTALLEAVKCVLGQPASRDIAFQNKQQMGRGRDGSTETHHALNSGHDDKEKRERSDKDGEDEGVTAQPDAVMSSSKRTRAGAKGKARMLETEGMEWIMSVLPRVHDTKDRGIDVKLAPPPPGHHTTSILKPIITEKTASLPEPPQSFSPLDYQTNIGNASVVHNIYLEARRAAGPRTPAEERSRRKRALQMAFREIMTVIGDIEWYRKGMGFKSGLRPSVLIGLENIPEKQQDAWLLQKLDAIKDRQCQVRCAIAEDREARLHIIAVIDAVLDTRQAGADGIVF